MTETGRQEVSLNRLGLAGVAAKRVSRSEAYPHVSRDGGLQGVSAIRALLGSCPQRLAAVFVGLSEAEGETVQVTDVGTAYWHDPRADNPSRGPEPRAYLTPPFLHQFGEVGDLAIVLLHDSGDLTLVLAQSGSSAELQLLAAFGLRDPRVGGRGVLAEADRVVDVAKYREVFESIGLPVAVALDSLTSAVLESACRKHAGCGLDDLLGANTETRVVSAIAREVAPQGDTTADEQLVAWLNAEEDLYYLAEEACYRDQVAAGFDSVQQMLEFAKAPLQRRRSRAGHSLENHFRHILEERGVPHAPAGTRTENKSTPDVLVPSKAAYDDVDLPDAHVTMVALKRTCKDRWRQILREADRVSEKFLLTVDPGLSSDQVKAMRAEGLRLVVPAGLHDEYEPDVQHHLLTVEQCVAELQAVAKLHEGD